MEIRDMLWDQRTYKFEGNTHLVEFICYSYKRHDGLMIYGVTSGKACPFTCECYCNHPDSGQFSCPNSPHYTEDGCPLRKMYFEG